MVRTSEDKDIIWSAPFLNLARQILGGMDKEMEIFQRDVKRGHDDSRRYTTKAGVRFSAFQRIYGTTRSIGDGLMELRRYNLIVRRINAEDWKTKIQNIENFMPHQKKMGDPMEHFKAIKAALTADIEELEKLADIMAVNNARDLKMKFEFQTPPSPANGITKHTRDKMLKELTEEKDSVRRQIRRLEERC